MKVEIKEHLCVEEKNLFKIENIDHVLLKKVKSNQ